MLNEMQTDFAETVGIKHGLERGIEGSKAKHQSIKKYYAAIQQSERQTVIVRPEAIEPKVLKKGIFTDEVESLGMVANRLTDTVEHAYQGISANAAISIHERERADDLNTTMQNQRKQLIAARKPFHGLTKSQIKKVVELTEEMKLLNKEKSKHVEQGKDNGFEI